MVAVPEAVRIRAVSQGQGAWLTGLDDQLRRLCANWGLTPGQVLDGGTASLVLGVTCADGAPAVLKLVIPGIDFHDQLRLLELADGRGYVRVLGVDQETNGYLLESLGGSLADADLPPQEQIRAVCDLLRVAWEVPATSYLDQSWNNAEELARLITKLWNRHNRPCPERVVDQALGYAARRAAMPRGEWVVVHGDPHPGNVLRSPDAREGSVGGYVFVDPTGFLADPAYDVGILMRDWSDQLLASDDPRGWQQHHCALAAGYSGLDCDTIAEWAYIERVSSGLFVLDVGDPDHGRRFLQTAELLIA
ncbi:kinase [Microlunatus endophyticus]|uniref:Kinase n=1 Tax=Microlunatus endophyticus TaxID=1716077 RepID=A0A917W8S1_9ACTN|nr:aminoglycoside phosphotransferase family protein [Microlunatus endophyticus]GGL78050.1 kinase [Microlunatus endophyticus]